jgi:hypothetical protein
VQRGRGRDFVGVLIAVPGYAAIQLITREVIKPRMDQR